MHYHQNHLCHLQASSVKKICNLLNLLFINNQFTKKAVEQMRALLEETSEFKGLKPQ
jgi:hypothetical protein